MFDCDRLVTRRATRTILLLAESACLFLVVFVSSSLSDDGQSVTVPIIADDVCPIKELRISETAYAAIRKPPGEGPFPAIVLMHGGLGQSNMQVLKKNAREQVTAARFLAWGYVTVNATRRKINHDPQDQGVIEDTVAIISAVKKMPYVDSQSIVLYGGSGGGTLALEVAGHTDLAAVAAGEPATIIYMGMFTKHHVVTNDSGQPTGDRRWDVMNADAKALYTPELKQLTRSKLATIRCPVLILHGDRHALKKFNFGVFIPEMKAMGKSVELKMYPGENHGFYWGRSDRPEMPLKANRDADAFFRRHLETMPVGVEPSLIRNEPVKASAA